jgi:hypothetical protein
MKRERKKKKMRIIKEQRNNSKGERISKNASTRPVHVQKRVHVTPHPLTYIIAVCRFLSTSSLLSLSFFIAQNVVRSPLLCAEAVYIRYADRIDESWVK